MQAEIFFFAHDNLTDARERHRDRTVGRHGGTGRVPHARVGLTNRVHVTVLVEVVALTPKDRKIQPPQIVAHQQAPMDIVPDGMGETIEHLVTDDQALTIQGYRQALHFVGWNGPLPQDLSRLRVDNRHGSAKGIRYH